MLSKHGVPRRIKCRGCLHPPVCKLAGRRHGHVQVSGADVAADLGEKRRDLSPMMGLMIEHMDSPKPLRDRPGKPILVMRVRRRLFKPFIIGHPVVT